MKVKDIYVQLEDTEDNVTIKLCNGITLGVYNNIIIISTNTNELAFEITSRRANELFIRKLELL